MKYKEKRSHVLGLSSSHNQFPGVSTIYAMRQPARLNHHAPARPRRNQLLKGQAQLLKGGGEGHRLGTFPRKTAPGFR